MAELEYPRQDDTPGAWRLADYIEGPGSWQMAADLFFYRAIENHPQPVVVRFYRFVPPTISIGYHQTLTRAVDVDACRTAGIELVRRPTGGRALLHDNEINYAVIADIRRATRFGPGLNEAFNFISRALAAALERLGLCPQIAGDSSAGHGGPGIAGGGVCAASTTKHEITCGGEKIIAAAQLRSGNCVLQHGTIYLDLPRPAPPEFFPAVRRLPDSARNGMLDLRRLLGVLPPLEDILDAFHVGFKETFGQQCVELPFSPDEINQIEHLAAGFAESEQKLVRK